MGVIKGICYLIAALITLSVIIGGFVVLAALAAIMGTVIAVGFLYYLIKAIWES